MAVASRRRAPPKKKAKPKRWIINGKRYREEELGGAKHPMPAKADYYAPVDEVLLKKIRTDKMVNWDTGKADLENGVPVELVLSYTDRGIVLKGRYGLKTKRPWKSRTARDDWGDPLKVMRGAVVGSQSKIYYRDVVTSPDPDAPMERTLQIAAGHLTEPRWHHWSGKRGIPVGREDEYPIQKLILKNESAWKWTEKPV